MAVVRGETTPTGGGVGELIAIGLAVVGVAVLWAMQLVMVPSYAAMFADFGGELPAITRAAIAGVIAGGATLLALVLAALGIVIRRWKPGVTAWIALGLAVVTPAAATIVLLGAMYAPIFDAAGAISAP